MWFLGQKLCAVARVQRNRHTDTQTDTKGTLSGFQEFFLQPIIKDRPNNNNKKHNCKICVYLHYCCILGGRNSTRRFISKPFLCGTENRFVNPLSAVKLKEMRNNTYYTLVKINTLHVCSEILF